MTSLVVLLIVSILIQYLVERVKEFIPDSAYDKVTKYIKPPIISLVFAIIVTFGCRIGLLNNLGININPVWLDYIITSIALSGGSVGINELFKSLQSIKEGNQVYNSLFSNSANEVEESSESTVNSEEK